MSNYNFKLIIRPEDIYNKLLPEQRAQFTTVEIVGANLDSRGIVEIECLALDDNIVEKQEVQALLTGIYISAI